MAILKGKKVSVEINGETKIGTVRESYISRNNETVFIIELEGGEFIKASERNVQEYKEPAPKKKDEVTITREEFRELVTHTAADMTAEKKDLFLGIVFVAFGAELSKRIFDEGEND